MRSEGELHVQAMRLVCEALEDREENGLEVDWDVINQQLDHMDVILQGIADQRSDDAEEIQTLKKERDAAREQISTVRDQVATQIETLKGAMAADDKRLRDAEERVWPGETRGCDAPDLMADEILSLRQQLADAQREVSNHLAEQKSMTVEWQQDTATWQQRLREVVSEIETLKTQLDDARAISADLQQQLDVSRKETTEVRRRNFELVKERDAALTAVSLQRAGIERLNAFVERVRSVIDNDCDGLEIDLMIEALAELNAGTEPAPATEPAQPPKIDVDFDNAWKRRYGVSAYEQSTNRPEGGQ